MAFGGCRWLGTRADRSEALAAMTGGCLCEKVAKHVERRVMTKCLLPEVAIVSPLLLQKEGEFLPYHLEADSRVQESEVWAGRNVSCNHATQVSEALKTKRILDVEVKTSQLFYQGLSDRCRRAEAAVKFSVDRGQGSGRINSASDGKGSDNVRGSA